MNVLNAKQIARQWVDAVATHMPGFQGAFFHGSVNWLTDDAVLSAGSDLDVMVVLDHPPAIKLGKFLYNGVLLEVSYLPRDQIQSPEQILGQSHLAGSFRAPSVIQDPTGQLTKLHAVVARNYAKRIWVKQRCMHASSKVLHNLQSVYTAETFIEQFTAWLFAAGVTTHVLLVAGLQNPTVRRRYLATRRLLEAYHQQPFYENLLEMLGCANMSPTTAEQHLSAMANAFDSAKAVIRSPFPFASNLSDIARPIAVNASRTLVESGDHREAVFWIAATYARCMQVLANDGSAELQARHNVGFLRLLGDLGIVSYNDLIMRTAQVEATLPHVWAVAETIMAANPEIED